MHDPASGLNLPEKCPHGVDLHFTCVECDSADLDLSAPTNYYEEHPDND